jgi:hypothetical protein
MEGKAGAAGAQYSSAFSLTYAAPSGFFADCVADSCVQSPPVAGFV